MTISKRIILGGAALALGLTLSVPHSPIFSSGSSEAWAAVDVSINVGAFYDRLAAYGDWVRRGGVYVFVPAVDAEWRPYTLGHWEYTNRFGWLWVSDEPFGWATYHYGRWGFDEEIGWFWVPATEWAPAWVSWRRSDDYVGWAPLPPDRDTGLAFDIDIDSDRYADRYWAVVPGPEFLAPRLDRIVVRFGDTRFKTVFRNTRPLGRVKIVNKIVVNDVIKVTDVERITRKKVRVKEVREVDNAARADKGGGDTVDIFAPKVERAANAKPKAVKTVEDVSRKHKRQKATGNAMPEEQTGTTQEQGTIVKKNKKKNEQVTMPEENNQPQSLKKKRLQQQQDTSQGTGEQAVQPLNKKKRRQLEQSQGEMGNMGEQGGTSPVLKRKQKAIQQLQEGQPAEQPGVNVNQGRKAKKKCVAGAENCPG
jgi:hypothetical protein